RFAADRARHCARHRGAGARNGASSAHRHRARHARAHSHRAGHERKNVGACRHAGERGEIKIAGRRVHWTGGRDAGLWLRRRWPVVESGGHRFSRRISFAAARSADRVKFVITAGPTREPIDPVRFLSNRSSGKMGYAIAAAAIEAGHEAVLISGPVCLEPPPHAKTIRVNTSDQMYDAVHAAVADCDVLVMCAAVADYKPAEIARAKIKKREEKLSLPLVPTRDILRSLPRRRNMFVVGFAAETHELERNARAKLRHKNCHMMVAN